RERARAMKRPIVAGVFVGGASRRMGGKPKGLLEAPDGQTIAARTIALARAVASEVVLVGAHGAYEVLGGEAIEDAAPSCGPLGGLGALLERGGEGLAIAIACDMPGIPPELLARLVAAEDAPIVAPRIDDRWSPLFARYDAPKVAGEARARLA